MSLSFGGLRLTSLDAARGTYLLLGCLSTTVGLRAMLNPPAYAALFGVPSASPNSTSADRNIFIPVAGGSRVAGGLALLACFWLRQDKGAAIMLLTGTMTAINDGLLLRADVDRLAAGVSIKSEAATKELEQARSHAWGHIAFGPVAAIVGAYLYYVS